MANLFAFALAENRLVYQPGETISGSLLLNTDKELNLRSIRVELQGTGHVRIRSGKVTYERREPYLGFQIVVLGRGENLTRKLLFLTVRFFRRECSERKIIWHRGELALCPTRHMIENLLAYSSFRSITESFSSIEYSILGFETSFTLNVMIIQVARSSQQCKNTSTISFSTQTSKT